MTAEPASRHVSAGYKTVSTRDLSFVPFMALCSFCRTESFFSRVHLLKVSLDNLKGQLDGKLGRCWSHSHLVLNVFP